MPKDELINMDNEAKISQIERAQTVTSTEAQFFADIIKDYFDNGRPSSFEKYERPLTTRLPQFLKFVEFDGLIVLIQISSYFVERTTHKRTLTIISNKSRKRFYVHF